VLLYRSPLSQLARERLKVIRETNDGLSRSPVGTWSCAALANCSAHGRPGLAQLRVADLVRDSDLLPRVQQAAE